MQLNQDILDNISTGILALDEQLLVTEINSSAQTLLEVSKSRAMGLHASQLLLRSGDWLEHLEQTLRDNHPLSKRGMPLVLLTGQEIHVDMILNLSPGAEGNRGLLVELQPVDQLLRISREEGIMHAQEAFRAVIRGLAHEIKNPLGGLRGAAQLLARELPGDDLAEYTEVIIREADRLRDLVNRLLSPHHQMMIQDLNIHEVLEHVSKLIIAESANLTHITRDYDPSLPELRGDRSQLIQAVLNIMQNAFQAAARPEDCQISLRTRSQRQFTIGSVRHRLVCQVDITDNGPGIAEELRHTLFAPMVTDRPEGTGLGLSIAQSIVNRHGGVLEYVSEPGQTTFTLYLPMESNNARTS
ncbi:MAG: PAS domain-containing protein [Halieaceae bacterium]|jgi:two-component system, NtrC family, nitrogen regulation sensor histidine kinase GlnL|nr:PAS domain-containing protein [Halieaceae bacterium]